MGHRPLQARNRTAARETTGRIADPSDGATGPRYASAFHAIARELAPRVILTPTQSIIFADLTPPQIERAEQLLTQHDVPTPQHLSKAQRFSMACPALPTCGLALAESERVQPELIQRFETELDRLGLSETDITIRMTGCPNGCARPYNADIGIVGRKPGAYHVYVGGGLSGNRLADLYQADVPLDEIVTRLRPLLERFARDRHTDESLGDFYRRAIATDRPSRTLLTGREEPTAPRHNTEATDDR